MKSVAEIQNELEELDVKKSALNAELEKARKAGRRAALAEILASLVKAGLTIEEVAEAYDKRKVDSSVKAEKQPKPPKYQDPVSNKTWNGVGKPPNWLFGDRATFEIRGRSK